MLTEASAPDPKSKAILGFRLCVAASTPAGGSRATGRIVYAIAGRLSQGYRLRRRDGQRRQRAAGADNAEAAAWAVVANILMNLDETVTKG